MKELVKEYVTTMFSEYLEYIELPKFVDDMIVILHSHRYQKGDEFLNGLDTSVIRGILY